MAVKFQIGEIVSAPPNGEALLKMDDNGDLAIVGSDGSESGVGGGSVESVTGDGIDNTDPANPEFDLVAAITDATPTAVTAELDTATNTAAGLMPFGAAAGQARVKSTLLTDADASIAPGTDNCSRYILPAGTLTANRALTVAVTGSSNSDSCEIVVLDTSANTYEIRNSGGVVVLFTKGASRPATIFRIYMTAGEWVANEKMWCGA